ncbi:MAG: SH3 domain-containing protein [Chloroflexi bacterium]|nr:SH3 domain-containing protein [Chloroflexota bacterium]
MQNKSGLRRIAADRVTSLPWLPPPAGYIILIQDVAYGNRYKIARHQRLDRNLIRRGADFPFETKVVRILEADNAAEAERELHDELAPGAPAGDWFDLQRYPPAKPRPAPQLGMVSLRDLARNDGVAESLLQGSEIVDATSRASEPQRRATSDARALSRRRPRALRWALLLMLLVIAGVLAAAHSSDFRNIIDSILDPSLPGASSRRAVSPTTKPDDAGPRSAPPATRITLSQPKLLLAGRTETSIRINWHRMPQALSYQFGYSVNGGAYSAWKSVNRFTHKIAGLSPGDRVIFRLRARRDGLYSPLAQISARTLPAPSPTPISPTATATATNPPPLSEPRSEPSPTATPTDTPAPSATPLPPTAASTATRPPPTATPTATETAILTATDTPAPTATATLAPAVKYVVETVDNLNANVRACPSTTCDIVARYAPGTEVDVVGEATGETVYGTDVWLEIRLNDGSAYIHSELVAEAE